MSEQKKPRVVLGPKALALGARVSGDEEQVTAAQLEDAIEGLHAQVAALEREKTSGENTAVSRQLRKLIQTETDQLHHELTTVLAAQHKEVVNLVNGVRFMLNTFAEDITGADVEELIKATNDWLDQTVKPIAETRAEGEKLRAADGRPENENDAGRDHETASSQVNQPVVSQEEKQDELPFQNAHKERDEYER